jgi:hypothetical protein
VWAGPGAAARYAGGRGGGGAGQVGGPGAGAPRPHRPHPGRPAPEGAQNKLKRKSILPFKKLNFITNAKVVQM